MPMPKKNKVTVSSKRIGRNRFVGKAGVNAPLLKALSFRGQIGAADGRVIFLGQVFSKMPRAELREIKRLYRERKKTRIPMTKTLEAAALKLALNRAFMSHVGELGLLKSDKRIKLKKIINQAYGKGEISLQGETEIRFSKETELAIRKILKKHAGSFTSELREYLRYEAGEVRFYIRSNIDPTASLGSWEGLSQTRITKSKVRRKTTRGTK